MDAAVQTRLPAFDIGPQDLRQLAALAAHLQGFGELIVLWLAGLAAFLDQPAQGLIVGRLALGLAIYPRLLAVELYELRQLLPGSWEKRFELAPTLYCVGPERIDSTRVGARRIDSAERSGLLLRQL